MAPYTSLNHGYPALCHAHISKAGGSSVNLIMASEKQTIYAPEECARKLFDHSWCQLARPRSEAVYLVMLRSPRAHVLSQYMECAYSKWGMGVVSKSPEYRAFPRHSKGQPSGAQLASHFDQWVRHFSPAWTPEQGNFDCYTPWDFETRYLSCGMPGAPDPMADHHGKLRNRSRGNVMDSRQPRDESIALKMLNTFAEHGVVGVTELFDESLCLVRYKMSGALPPSCACDAPPSTAPHGVHDNRGVPAHSLADVWNSTLTLVDEITSIDAQVYVTGLAILLSELAALSRKLNVQLICEGRLDKVRAAVAYIPQADVLLHDRYWHVQHGFVRQDLS
tara:strand:+ start:1155 stop:2159 length:1005 start_codon:yes stop_codon:yes gene_type:complete